MNQQSWSQNQGGSQEHGLTGIERDGNNVKLHFVFCESGQSECERQTLTDDDGLASVTAVLSELKREYYCGPSVVNVNDEVPNWDQISTFIEDRLERSQDYCQEQVCNVGNPVAVVDVPGSDRPEVYLMEHCGQLIRQSEELIDELGSKDKVTYKDLEKLAGLLDKAAYSIYTVDGKSTGESIIGLGSSSNIGQVAQHHQRIQFLGLRARSRKKEYFNNHFTFASGKKNSEPPSVCQGVGSGRLAGLIPSNSSSPASSSNASGTGI